jgi:hypothetical protein
MVLLLLLFPGCDLVPDVYTADGARDCDPRSAFYADADGDGAGDPLSVYIGCAAPSGYVATATDCNDLDPDVTTDCGPGDSGG